MGKFKTVCLGIIVLQIGLGLLSLFSPTRTLVVSGIAQGTQFRVIADLPFWVTNPQLSRVVISIFDHIDHQVSVYDATSEISKFNRLGAFQPMPISGDFVRLFQFGQRLHVVSKGQWDATVGGAVVDYNAVQVSQNMIWKTDLHVRLCFDSIAQGYTLDRLIENLVNLGASLAVVEIGGEVRVYSTNRSKQRIRIAVPDTEYTQFSGEVMINNEAISTSGRENGQVKIIDPSGGKVRDNPFQSVIVVARTGVEADGLSTALWVSDPSDWPRIVSAFPGSRVVSPAF